MIPGGYPKPGGASVVAGKNTSGSERGAPDNIFPISAAATSAVSPESTRTSSTTSASGPDNGFWSGQPVH
jgi:hypothetical protein